VRQLFSSSLSATERDESGPASSLQGEARGKYRDKRKRERERVRGGKSRNRGMLGLSREPDITHTGLRAGTEIVGALGAPSRARRSAAPATDMCPGAIFKFPFEARLTKFGPREPVPPSSRMQLSLKR